MVLDKPIDYLDSLQQDERIVTVLFDREILTNSLRKAIPAVKRVEKGAVQGEYRVVCPGDDDVRAAIFRYAVDSSVVILEMAQERATVENVFQYLTKN